jgi:hypothetical protein
MISANIPLAGRRLEEIDLYDDNKGYVQYSNGSVAYKNTYWLDFARTRNAHESETTRQQFEWVGNLSNEFLVFTDCEFGIAVARKSHGRKGLYFSGVPVDRARPLMPPVLHEALRDAPGGALIDVAYDVVDGRIVNTCVYSGYIAYEHMRGAVPMDKHIVTDGVNARVLRSFAAPQEVDLLRLLYSPDRSRPYDYPLSFGGIGSARAERWNNVPVEESYHRHGVLVRDHTGGVHTGRMEGETRLPCFEWITRRVQQLVGPVRLIELRTKTHIEHSNGVWLHTDSQRERLDWLGKDAGKGMRRDFLLLLYLTTLHDKDDGKLHVFSNSSDPDVAADALHFDAYQSGVRVEFTAPVVTSKVGGEWRHGQQTFRSVLELTPVAGSAVLLDHRLVDNVHAVSQMQTSARRELVEAWFAGLADDTPA